MKNFPVAYAGCDNKTNAILIDAIRQSSRKTKGIAFIAPKHEKKQ